MNKFLQGDKVYSLIVIVNAMQDLEFDLQEHLETEHFMRGIGERVDLFCMRYFDKNTTGMSYEEILDWVNEEFPDA